MWAGAGVSFDTISGSLDSTHALTLDYVESGGIAGQSLDFESRNSPSMIIGADLWPTARFGFQLLANASRAEITGSSTPYEVRFEYVSSPPPDFHPRKTVYERSTSWPRPTGDVETLTLALNGVSRWSTNGRFSGTLAAGVAATRVSGELDSLGFTTFDIYHYALFAEQLQIGMALEPAWSVGFDLGATAELEITSRLKVVVGVRYDGNSSVEVPVVAREILNPDEIINGTTLEDVKGSFTSPPANIDLGGTRVFVGLKLAIR